MTSVFNSLENVGKPVWFLLMIVSFIWFWPLGLAIFAYLAWTGRFGAWINLKPWTFSFYGSGNAAFDEHRADILSKLEQERKDFDGFINDLKKAKDKAEFDDFMAKRKQ
jgi:hypothetical protein